jgi:hypothetical protein
VLDVVVVVTVVEPSTLQRHYGKWMPAEVRVFDE